MSELMWTPTAEEVRNATLKAGASPAQSEALLKQIQVSLPLILEACIEQKMVSIHALVAVLATVATECSFKSVKEYGGDSYYFRMYDPETTDPKRKKVAKALGNTTPGDGVKFCGRGFIQLTGRTNYVEFGKQLSLPLAVSPDLVLEPKVAARVLALFMRQHGCDVWAVRGHWRRVRKLVNGGYNHFDYFQECVYKLLDAAYAKGRK